MSAPAEDGQRKMRQTENRWMWRMVMMLIIVVAAMITVNGENDANGRATILPLLWQVPTLHTASFRDTNGVCLPQCKLWISYFGNHHQREKYCKPLREILQTIERNTANHREKYYKPLREILQTGVRNIIFWQAPLLCWKPRKLI